MEDLFENQRRCQYCKSILKGRSDKKFCDISCKNAFHNPLNRNLQQKFKNDDRKLHNNYQVLYRFYEHSKGLEFIQLRPLLQEGFDPRFFVGTMRARDTGETVYIVYNYAFYCNQNSGIKIYFNERSFHPI
jgi:hypothetical protein